MSDQGDSDRVPDRLREWPTALVITGLVVSLLIVASGQVRVGSVLLAASVILAAFLRLLLTEDEAGMLAVRTKAFDVAVLGALGVGLGVLAFIVPDL